MSQDWTTKFHETDNKGAGPSLNAPGPIIVTQSSGRFVGRMVVELYNGVDGGTADQVAYLVTGNFARSEATGIAKRIARELAKRIG